MPARPLLKLATEACIANLRHLYDVGEVPYHLVRPVLLKLGSPDQLRKIEIASPQICGADAEIWRNFIKRDIPNWESKRHEPKNPLNWWKVYQKLKREVDQDRTKSAAKLKAEYSQIDAEKRSQHITFDHSLTVPGGRRRIQVPQQQQRPARPTDASAVAFRSGSKIKTTTGKSILQKARREAREASHFGSGSGSAPMRGGGPGSRAISTSTATALLSPRPAAGSSSKTQASPGIGAVASSTTSGANQQQEEEQQPKMSVQASREEASLRRERALAQHRTAAPAPVANHPPAKRPASNVFMPSKKRKV